MKNVHFNQYVEDALSNKEGRICGEIRDREKMWKIQTLYFQCQERIIFYILFTYFLAMIVNHIENYQSLLVVGLIGYTNS